MIILDHPKRAASRFQLTWKIKQMPSLTTYWRAMLHGFFALLYILPCVSGMEEKVSFTQSLRLSFHQITFKQQVISLWDKDLAYSSLTMKKVDPNKTNDLVHMPPTHLKVPSESPLCLVKIAAQMIGKNMLILWKMIFLCAKNTLSLVRSDLSTVSFHEPITKRHYLVCPIKISVSTVCDSSGLRIRNLYPSFPSFTTHLRFPYPQLLPQFILPSWLDDLYSWVG